MTKKSPHPTQIHRIDYYNNNAMERVTTKGSILELSL